MLPEGLESVLDCACELFYRISFKTGKTCVFKMYWKTCSVVSCFFFREIHPCFSEPVVCCEWCCRDWENLTKNVCEDLAGVISSIVQGVSIALFSSSCTWKFNVF